MKVVLDQLTKVFKSQTKNGKDVIAANKLNVEIKDGTLVSLLGPSGCGKSTCLNLISGLIEPSDGHIYFNSDDVTNLPPENRGIGMVFQNYALYPHLTVRQNIRFPLENLTGKDKLSKEEIEAKVMEASKIVQIEEYLDRKPKQLSGGQQQRVAIARALVKTPNVLLLDEPLSNLDARLRLQTREQIRRIQQKTKITTIFVTHDQEEAMSISDMIVVMKDGTIQQAGKPQEVYLNPCNLFVAKFLGTPAINVFNGRVEKKKLYIGKDCVGKYNVPDQEVYVGIRPEALIPDLKGTFVCALDRVEVMGRDVSIVCHNKESISENNIRAMISSDIKINEKNKNIKFKLNPLKTYIFSKTTEERLDEKK